MTDQKRTWYYGWLFFLALAIAVISFFLIDSIFDNHQFNKYGSRLGGQITKVTQRGKDGFYYLIQYSINDTTYTDQLYSLRKIGEVSDSISLFYLKNTKKVGFTSELNDWGFNPTLLIILLCLVIAFFLVYKKPDLITRFKGELDNQG